MSITYKQACDKYLGKIYYNNYNEFAKVIKYYSYADVTIKFNNGFVKNTRIGVLKSGKFNNPYTPTVYGVGYLGEGKYKTTCIINNKKTHTVQYLRWRGVMARGYSNILKEKHPTYENCSVCEEWHNFQNFAQWYDNNLWDDNFTEVDKDILIKGNKVYSPETCILVNHELNTLFLNLKETRGNLPIGVVLHKGTQYRARCSMYGEKQHVGVYNTPEEAFLAYKTFRESYIKQVANEYRDKYLNFPQKLYDAMYNWEIEIAD